MAKVVTEGFLADTVNGIKINTSIPCNSANYEKIDKREVKYIVVHYTGNIKDTSKNNAKYFNSTKGTNASAHLFVDDNEIYQSIAYHDKAWHVGTKTGYKHIDARNSNSIGIEMSTTAGNYTVSNTTIKNTEYLCAYLCKILNISAKDVDTYVIRHYDVTGKICPAQMVNNLDEWISFKQSVKNILNNSTVSNIDTVLNNYPVPTIVLKQGVKGEAVKWLQQALNDIGNYNLVVDGSFGVNTLKAVKDYQKSNGLDVDGSVGQLTRASILNSLNNLNTSKKEVVEKINTDVSTNIDEARYIWEYSYNKLNNAYGASGLWGNIKAESGLKANNLQDTFEKKLGYTNISYTNAVDNGTYKNFVKDGAGYGICQWTYLTRKQGLYNYAKAKKVSIGDITMQLEYLFKELEENYPNVLKVLKNAKSVKEASDIVLTGFEKPANQGAPIKNVRAKYCQEGYDKYASISTSINAPTSKVITPVVQSNKTNINTGILSNNMYKVQIGLYLSQNSAKNMSIKLNKAGYGSVIIKINFLYTVQLGVFNNSTNAANLVKELKKKGFNAIIKQS